MSGRDMRTETVVIIGGGVSGALTAYHLLRQTQARVIVIEPRAALGLGLAYSTPSLRHLLNVPAGKISALPAEPDHFLRWLQRHADPEATAETFAPRAIFGRYVHELLETTRGITHLRGTVVDVEETAHAARLTLADGQTLNADAVVLATGNFDPAPLPGVDPQAAANGAYCQNAWANATYQALPPEAAVTLIGSGLTAVDVLLRLRELGHRGVVTAVSRHGVLPNRHAACAPAGTSAIPPGTPATSLAYLRAFRASLAAGVEWRSAVDSLRASTNELWLALPPLEQKRFRRHLSRRWDVVRHRMAPAVAEVIEAELAAGTLLLREGRLQAVKAAHPGARVTIETKHGSETLDTARVINCTGPAMDYRRVDSPLLRQLFARGLATAGPLGTGFRTTQSGALVSSTGAPSQRIYNVGPGRLGTLLESIAVPELRQQACEIAEVLATRQRAESATHRPAETVREPAAPALA